MTRNQHHVRATQLLKEVEAAGWEVARSVIQAATREL